MKLFRNIPDHMPCRCGHMGWRHWDDGSCARCGCERFVQDGPRLEHPLYGRVRYVNQDAEPP